MKPRSNLIMEHEGTFVPQAETRMTVDVNNIGHIMSILTDMYSDTELAVIREYSTNALDSHRTAGNPDPIEIELPSSLRPLFVVRDHGIGMSVDDIMENFSKYGWSSKRDTDNEVGLLGIGCKSGLTYTNQFSLTAIKDMVQTKVLITRDPDGTGKLQVLDTTIVDEPNGVEIQIPVTNVRTFANKANQFFQYWEPGCVLVNGNAPESIFDAPDGFLNLDPDVIVTKNNEHDYVVMGNIPYPVVLNTDILGHGFHIVARVEIGEVDFTPSRESLHMTARTKEVVAMIQGFVRDRVDTHIQEQIDAAPTRWDALKVAKEWEYVTRNRYARSATYRGIPVPRTIPIVGQEWRSGYSRTKASKTTYMNPETLARDTTIVVLDHPQRSMDTATKDSIMHKYPKATLVYVVQNIGLDMLRWISGANLVAFEDVKPPKVFTPRAKSAIADTSTWWVRVPKTTRFVQDSTPSELEAPICYIMRSDSGGYNWEHVSREAFRNRVGAFLETLDKPLSATLVLLSATDLKRFTKKYPDAKHFRQYIQDRLVAIEAQLTDEQLLWALQHHALATIDENTILDPDVRNAIVRIKLCLPAEKLNEQRAVIMREFPRLVGDDCALHSRIESAKSRIPSLLKTWEGRYPMISRNTHLTAHHIEYMNAVWSYRAAQ